MYHISTPKRVTMTIQIRFYTICLVHALQTLDCNVAGSKASQVSLICPNCTFSSSEYSIECNMCGEPLPYGRATAAKQQASPKHQHHHHDSSKSSSHGGHANKNIWIDTNDDSNSDEHAHHHVKQKRYVCV
jgi:hypothetical protein